MNGRSNRKLAQTIDWWIIGCWLTLALIGVVCIYSSCQGYDPDPGFSFKARYGKQLIWILISAVAAFVILFIVKPHVWEVLSMPMYLAVLLLLIAVIVLGSEVNGSKSWFHLGPISFQPCELSKITTSLVLAHFLRAQDFKLSRFRDLATVVMVIGIPTVIILAEGEAGTLLVYLTFAFVLYREGMSGWWLAALLAVVILFIASMKWPLWVAGIILVLMVGGYFAYGRYKGAKNYAGKRDLWIVSIIAAVVGAVIILSTNLVFNKVLRPHQRGRIEVLLGMREDPMGIGYNVNQSMIAIGSGGFTGKGFLQGTQTAYGFVPEQSTDFIFCTLGEEFGFLGCAAVILLFAALIWRILRDAEESREPFTRIYGYCVAGCFFMHLCINVGMTIGLMPVIGIPLPLISYGGSSMLAFTTMLFIFVALVRRERKYF